MNEIVLVCLILCISGTAIRSENEYNITEKYDQYLKSIYKSGYYNSKTNQTLKQLPVPYVPGHKPTGRQPFINLCECDNYRCACCAGVRIYGLDLDRRVCIDSVYDPFNLTIDLQLKMNDFVLYKNKVSAEEQDICVPVLPVAFIRSVQFCMRLYDIAIENRRLHACLKMVTMISDVPFVTLQFNCMEMGPDGVGISRPGEVSEPQPSLPLITSNSSSTTSIAPPEQNQQDSDVYNPVPDS